MRDLSGFSQCSIHPVCSIYIYIYIYIVYLCVYIYTHTYIYIYMAPCGTTRCRNVQINDQAECLQESSRRGSKELKEEAYFRHQADESGRSPTAAALHAVVQFNVKLSLVSLSDSLKGHHSSKVKDSTDCKIFARRERGGVSLIQSNIPEGEPK